MTVYRSTARFAPVRRDIIGVKLVWVAMGQGSAPTGSSICAGGTNAVGDSSTRDFATVRRVAIGVKLVGVT